MKMLEGVKVLDFTTNAAGPIVGAYFADFSSIDEHPENRPANISTRIGENNYEVLKEWGKTEEEAKALLEKWGATKI